MADRKNIETSKVEGLIPRQLIEDSGALITFLKEYYNFLNKEGGPSYALNTLLENRDVDSAVNDFLELIHNEIGAGFAKEIRTLQADKNNLYKHIKEFYSCKGSLDSFQTLFKLIFNTDVEIILPKEQILIASDGRWEQQESFFIEATSGDPLDLYGNIITVISNENYIDVEVERVRKVYPAQDYYEIFITRNINTNRIEVGSTFTFNGIAGTVINSLGNIELIYGGSGFEVPQFVDIDYQSTGTLIRISEVNSSGVITKFRIISFGIGYTNDFYARIIPRDEIVSGVDLVVINEEDIDTETAAHPTHAILKFSNAAIAQYTGEFSNNKGFLSDDIYLQDNYYYQQFSYVIRSGLQIETYKDIVNKTVHPAGMIMFGEFEVTNEFDLSQNIQSIGRYLRARLLSQFSTTDVFSFHYNKPLDSSVSTSFVEKFDFNKPTASSVGTSFIEKYDYYKNVFGTGEEVTTAFVENFDFNKNVGDSGISEYVIPTTILSYHLDKPLDSSASTASIDEKDVYKNLTSSSIASDDIFIQMHYYRYFNSSIAANDALSLTSGGQQYSFANIGDTIAISSTKEPESSINITDTAIGSINPYSPGFFAEDYTEGTYILT